MRITAEDLQLIDKYNRPGPRYTSYPPANHFRDYENRFRKRFQNRPQHKTPCLC